MPKSRTRKNRKKRSAPRRDIKNIDIVKMGDNKYYFFLIKKTGRMQDPVSVVETKGEIYDEYLELCEKYKFKPKSKQTKALAKKLDSL